MGLRVNNLIGFGAASSTDALLLDSYPSASEAFSLRLLRTAYAGSAIRIREDSGGTETDIGFNADGSLDTSAIGTHCGANNGFVTKWYDQSGNANDAVQTTTTLQPKIYNGSAVLTNENGEPAILFDGTDDYLNIGTNNFSGTGDKTILAVIKTSDTAAHIIGTGSDSNGFTASYGSGLGIVSGDAHVRAVSAGSGLALSATTNVDDNTTRYIMGVHDSGSSEIWVDGTSEGTSASSINPHSYTTARIGASTGDDFSGSMMELVMWLSDLTSDASGIYSNQSAKWG